MVCKFFIKEKKKPGPKAKTVLKVVDNPIPSSRTTCDLTRFFLKMSNSGTNACFCNSIIQALLSLGDRFFAKVSINI